MIAAFLRAWLKEQATTLTRIQSFSRDAVFPEMLYLTSPERARQYSPGQSAAPPWGRTPSNQQALKGRYIHRVKACQCQEIHCLSGTTSSENEKVTRRNCGLSHNALFSSLTKSSMTKGVRVVWYASLALTEEVRFRGIY